jgi:hypothetical protein
MRNPQSILCEIERPHDQAAFEPLLYGVGLAITLVLKETGVAAR